MYAGKVIINAPLYRIKERYSLENLSVEEREGYVLLEDESGTELFGWEISSWLELAQGDELIYAYYDENMNAEFIHIKGGACLRAYQEYDGEVDTDEGEDPETNIAEWADVADYIDEHML